VAIFGIVGGGGGGSVTIWIDCQSQLLVRSCATFVTHSGDKVALQLQCVFF